MKDHEAVPVQWSFPLADAKCLGMGCTLQFDQIWMPELYIYKEMRVEPSRLRC